MFFKLGLKEGRELDGEQQYVLNIIGSILLNLNSVRPKPKKLLLPPVEVSVHSSARILTPLMIEQTHLGRKITIETDYTAITYLKGSESDERYRVLESRMTFLHIIEPDNKIIRLVGKPISELPKSVIEQIITITVVQALPLLIIICDRHNVPPPLKIPEVKVEIGQKQ